MTFRKNLSGIEHTQSADKIISSATNSSSCLMEVLSFDTAKSFSQDLNKCIIYSNNNGTFVVEEHGLIF